MSSLPSIPDLYVDLAQRLADAARPVVRRYFRTPVGVDDKPDTSPVTVADREAETVMRAILDREVPDHGIWGEEHGSERMDANWVWVLDPIDGTKAFITGMPVFGTLIALLYRGRPVLGVIDQPILQERWLGVSGRRSTFNGSAIATRACDALAKAYMYSTAPLMFPGDFERPHRALAESVKLFRWGGDCYAYGLLASGLVDLVVEASLKLHDFCALVPVIEGAGGLITDWRGQPLDRDSDGTVLAAGDRMAHAAALAVLAGGEVAGRRRKGLG
ncbi:MAG: histidinol-phosphatase [Alphaproteobacteria bacterium]|nr:histidinol-phosphatase [Alphaproteobacteria bacterium]